MKREEFLMEAALRLITAKPEEKMSEIATMANDITERVFNTAYHQKIDTGRWWSEEADKAPVNAIIKHIEEKRPSGGYGVRLDRVFRLSNIVTVGDLLRIGSRTFRKYRDVADGSIYRISVALEELYNIQSW